MLPMRNSVFLDEHIKHTYPSASVFVRSTIIESAHAPFFVPACLRSNMCCLDERTKHGWVGVDLLALGEQLLCLAHASSCAHARHPYTPCHPCILQHKQPAVLASINPPSQSPTSPTLSLGCMKQSLNGFSVAAGPYAHLPLALVQSFTPHVPCRSLNNLQGPDGPVVL